MRTHNQGGRPAGQRGGGGLCRLRALFSPEQVKTACALGFDLLQIHGTLTEEALGAASLPVIKAFNVSDLPALSQWRQRREIYGLLLDAAQPGSGKAFDWNMAAALDRGEKRLFLAGGLTPENVGEAIRRVHPDGVDVSTGVERPGGGGKDPERVLLFLHRCKKNPGETEKSN